MSWKVLVVEDDPMVAAIHVRWLTRSSDFEVATAVSSAEEARVHIMDTTIDLVILDINLRKASGLELLESIRRAHKPVDVIVVTAARDADSLRFALEFGAVDYLVKPFTEERFAAALNAFSARRSTDRKTLLSQTDIDLACGVRSNTRSLPKGLSALTLRRVAACLESTERSASDVADEIGISRVVARRYLEHLVTLGRATCEPRYGQPGRPTKVYAAATPD
jgi:response regulator of citrate/malate metabolism